MCQIHIISTTPLRFYHSIILNPASLHSKMASLLRAATRLASRSTSYSQFSAIRASQAASVSRWTAQRAAFSVSSRKLTTGHEDETFEEFSTRVEGEFNAVNDVFELQVRGFFCNLVCNTQDGKANRDNRDI
jgi:hypothetical protein